MGRRGGRPVAGSGALGGIVAGVATIGTSGGMSATGPSSVPGRSVATGLWIAIGLWIGTRSPARAPPSAPTPRTVIASATTMPRRTAA